MDDAEKKTLLELYNKYGYGVIRGQLDAWDDEATARKMAYLSGEDENDDAS